MTSSSLFSLLHRSWVLFSSALIFHVAIGVEIREMRLPKVVESGVEDHIILDCLYEYGQSEAAQIDVKWFFGDDPQPFYQWLPGRRPQTIGELFRNRIDLDYEVETDDEYARHRAVKLLRPTAELSGTYKCKVSSFVDEDFMSKKMLVYAPAQDVRLIYTKPDSNSINLTCSAKGAFPQPEIRLTWGPSSFSYEETEFQTTTLTVQRDGFFDVTVHKRLNEEKLKAETVFGCLVTIPGTKYSVKEETMYFPGKVLYQIKKSSVSASNANSSWKSPAGIGRISSLVAVIILNYVLFPRLSE